MPTGNRAGSAQIGVVGLAVMGSNLARNFARHGYTVALYNRTQARTEAVMAAHGAEGTFVPSASVAGFAASLERPRRILLMVKAGAPTDATIDTLVPQLEPGDIVVDGGNAHFADTRRREEALRGHGLHFVGTGVSGGEEGALNGPSIMPGGDRQAYAKVEKILTTIAAQVDGTPCCTYVGPDGAGHYVKMVHNGIEYGMMQAYAEGFEILRRKEELSLRIAQIAEIWRYGSVVRSWLLDLTARALSENPDLEGIAPYVSDSGEGRWTVAEAIDLDVPAPIITLSLQARFRSRQADSFGAKVIAALRNEFGGHAVEVDE